MNEAPKKIWIHEGFWRSGDAGYWTGDEKTFSEDIHYIRADIVDELVEALEKGMGFNEAYWKLINFSPSDTGLIKELTDRARAALAKLEEK